MEPGLLYVYHSLPVCSILCTLKKDITTGGIRRIWQLDGLSLTDTGKQVPQVFTIAGDHLITLIATGSNGCPDSITESFRIHALPEAAIRALPKAATVTDPMIRFYGTPGMATAYFWAFGDGSSTSTLQGPVFTYPATIGAYNVQLQVTDENGCRDNAAIVVRIMPPEFFMPNAFSPNGDGHNDIFGIVNLTNQRLQEFSIFNRYGQRVFYTLNPDSGWDGTFRQQPAETGTYYYCVRLIHTDGSLQEIKGDITLMR